MDRYYVNVVHIEETTTDDGEFSVCVNTERTWTTDDEAKLREALARVAEELREVKV